MNKKDIELENTESVDINLPEPPLFEHTPIWKEGHKINHDWHIPKYNVSSIDQSYRVINHWCEIWLIDEPREEGKGWRKFNTYDIIWIKIIWYLRDLWISIETLKVVKHWLMFDMIEFQNYMISVLARGRKIEIIIYPDWRAFFASKKFKLKMEFDWRLEENYISLSFNGFLKKIFREKYNPPLKEPFFLPVDRERELKLFQTILDWEYQEIQVIFKDKKVDRYETIEEIGVNEEKYTESLNEFWYWDLTISKKENKVSAIKRRTIHK